VGVGVEWTTCPTRSLSCGRGRPVTRQRPNECLKRLAATIHSPEAPRRAQRGPGRPRVRLGECGSSCRTRSGRERHQGSARELHPASSSPVAPGRRLAAHLSSGRSRHLGLAEVQAIRGRGVVMIEVKPANRAALGGRGALPGAPWQGWAAPVHRRALGGRRGSAGGLPAAGRVRPGELRRRGFADERGRGAGRESADASQPSSLAF
jgi:hypothetical protein